MRDDDTLRHRMMATVSVFTILALPALPNAAQAGALPTGGQYVAGKGEIGKPGASLTVKQSSVTGIIDWNSFSVGQKNAVTFDNGKGATLNVVTGGNLSNIAGSLHATGSLYLMNPEGIVVSGSGHIVTGGSFVATSGALSGANFDKDELAPGKGKIVNRGSIVAGSGVTLNGGSVDETGTILARSAQGAGGTVTLRGDDISVSGKIDASANRAHQNGGIVSIVASGSTAISGGIAAAGGVGGKAGAIETSGHTLSLSRADIDAGTGGQWLLDPFDLTVTSSAASTIDASLNGGTNVSLVTTATGTSGPGTPDPSGNGIIFIDSAISWGTTATLSMSAYRNIDIDAPITVSGGGKVALTTGTGGTGNYSFDLGTNGFGGDISFTGGASSGAGLTINGASYTLLYSTSAIQAINSSTAALEGRYALATSLDASAITNWVPLGTNSSGTALNSGKGFSGTLEGLGNGISGLSINEPSISNIGLFGYSSGTIRDIDVTGGAFVGANSVGALVGRDAGQIEDAYANSAVTGDDDVGGLVGYDLDSGSSSQAISASYATGTVTGTVAIGGLVGAISATSSGNVNVIYSYATGTVDDTSSSAKNSGGLVGASSHSGAGNSSIVSSYATGSVNGGTDIGGLVGSNGGAISDSFSMGAVTSTATDLGSYIFGGLVGMNSGTIAQSYSTSPLLFGSLSGGLVGYDSAPSGSITSSYWNTQTSGISNTSDGVGNITNEPGITGLTTAQLQGTRPSGFSSSFWGTGPDLFPYLLWQFPTGTPQSISGSIGGCCFTNPGQYVSARVNGANATALSAASGYGGYYYVLLAPGTISPGGSGVVAYVPGTNGSVSFVDDAKSSVTGLALDFDTFEEVSAAPKYSTIASDLIAAIGTDTALQSQISGLAPFVIDDSAATFTVDAPIDMSSKSLTIDADDLSIAARITTTSVMLNAAGTISETGTGFIDASTLSGESDGRTALNTINEVAQLSAFTNSGSGGFSLVDGETLTIVDDNVINAGTGDLSLTVRGAGNNLSLFNGVLETGGTAVLNSSGNITQENGIGVVQAAALTGSAASGVTLDGNNLVTTLGAFSPGTGGFLLYDATNLTVSGAVNTGTAGLTITTTAYTATTTDFTSDLTIESALTGATVTLDAAGNLAETGAGIIHATTLDAGGRLKVDLGAANLFTKLEGGSGNGSTGDFSVVDADSMNVTGIMSQNTIELTTTGAGHFIVITGTLQTLAPYHGAITLDSAGTISESASGANIYSDTLNGSSVGGTTLNGSNNQTGLGNFTNSGAGGFSFNGGTSITGKISTGAGPITLSGGSLDIDSGGQLDTTGTLTLTAGDVEEQDSGASVDAGTLIATVSGEISLFGSDNAIANLGKMSAGQHLVIDDDRSVSITGAISSTYDDVSIQTLSGGITIGNTITADGAQYGAVQLLSAGPISETGAGLITSPSLQGSSAGNTILTAANEIANLYTFSTGNGAFSLSDAQALTVDDTVDTGTGTATFDVTKGNLVIGGALDAKTVDLNSSLGEVEGTGMITANLLNVTADTGIDLTGANDITTIGTNHTNSGPDVIDNN